jgi:hypothetical protein
MSRFADLFPGWVKIRCKATGKRLFCNPATGQVVDRERRPHEFFEGRFRPVIDGSRTGWWRFHEHYDRDGYCDNPARGY